jgi:hypothetical protein
LAGIVSHALVTRRVAAILISWLPSVMPASGVTRAVLQPTDRPTGHRGCYPWLTGTVCIASKTMAKMSTLQTVAQIPAFMAWSTLWLRRRNDATLVALRFSLLSAVVVAYYDQPSRRLHAAE